MTTEERLEAMEKELIRAKCHARGLLAAGLVAGGLLATVWLVGETVCPARADEGDIEARIKTVLEKARQREAEKAAKAAQVVWATEFVLVDAEGRERGAMKMGPTGPQLSLAGEDGKVRTVLGGRNDGGWLTLCDRNAKSRIGLAAHEDGAGLSLIDDKGEYRASICENKAGPGLLLFDDEGRTRAALGATQTGTPDGKTTSFPESSLLLFGADGKVRWSAP